MLQIFQIKPALAFAFVVALLFLARWLLLPLADALTPLGGLYALGARGIETSLKVAAIATAALPLQLLFPAVQRRPKVLSYEYWLDVLYWHQGLLLQLLSVPAAMVVLLHWVWSRMPGPWLPALASLPLWAQVLMAVWLNDLVVYWRHRTEHMFGALWSFHAVHHSAEQVDILTTLRLHPLEVLFASVTGAAVALIGLQGEAAVTGYAIYTLWNYFIHTNVRLRFPGFMKYVLVSPFMHHWHHALDREAAGKNVGVVFAWNDWLFGTAYHPEHWPSRFGIDVPDGQRVPQSYWRQLAYPLQYIWTALRAPTSKRTSAIESYLTPDNR
jgi:sterol desaturase/sphingolipid hydroxylase (fatty acid hydroxylase superfamily)